MKVRMGAVELVELGRLRCKPGQILREGYTRKDGTRVSPACVKDVGAKGKTPLSQRWLPALPPKPLGGWHKGAAESKRHSELVKKTRQRGCLEILRTINALANVTTDKKTEKLLRKDYKWLRKQKVCKLKTK